jgi:hypothetical protein
MSEACSARERAKTQRCAGHRASELEDEVDDLLGCPVGRTEIKAGDGDEAEYDCCGLRDLATVGPLHPLELGPAGTQEGDGTVVDRSIRLLCGQRPLRSRVFTKCSLNRRISSSTPPTASSRRDQLGWFGHEGALAVLLRLLIHWNSTGTTNECGIELIDISSVGKSSG